MNAAARQETFSEPPITPAPKRIRALPTLAPSTLLSRRHARHAFPFTIPGRSCSIWVAALSGMRRSGSGWTAPKCLFRRITTASKWRR